MTTSHFEQMMIPKRKRKEDAYTRLDALIYEAIERARDGTLDKFDRGAFRVAATEAFNAAEDVKREEACKLEDEMAAAIEFQRLMDIEEGLVEEEEDSFAAKPELPPWLLMENSDVQSMIALAFVSHVGVFVEHRDELLEALKVRKPNREDESDTFLPNDSIIEWATGRFLDAIDQMFFSMGAPYMCEVSIKIAHTLLVKPRLITDEDLQKHQFEAEFLTACATMHDAESLRERLRGIGIHNLGDVVITVPNVRCSTKYSATGVMDVTVGCVEAAALLGNQDLVVDMVTHGLAGVSEDLCQYLSCGGILCGFVSDMLKDYVTDIHAMGCLRECVICAVCAQQDSFVVELLGHINSEERRHLAEMAEQIVTEMSLFPRAVVRELSKKMIKK